jgi:hypothetical protein
MVESGERRAEMRDLKTLLSVKSKDKAGGGGGGWAGQISSTDFALADDNRSERKEGTSQVGKKKK